MKWYITVAHVDAGRVVQARTSDDEVATLVTALRGSGMAEGEISLSAQQKTDMVDDGLTAINAMKTIIDG